MSLLDVLVLGIYGAIALLLSLYGLHRYFLSAVYMRLRDQGSVARQDAELPVVTVQLPVFNERFVVQRLLDAVVELDWPAERLEIQVLDDSTDDTTEIAGQRVAWWVERGVDIKLLHREDRQGYKAGALEEGMAVARGEFIAVFDADFVPQADFLRRLMPHFSEGVGMVQARWGHLNEGDSLLTRLQAVLLDGHFVVEHTARNRSGRWFNFNGTAGVWRRQAIIDAGGWEHDTLTEDLDLSYRSQMAGWRFVFLPELAVPAELPPTMVAFKSQQHRWAKGSIQTLLKLSARLLSAPISWRIKLEAMVHLSANLAYPLVILLTLVTPFAVEVRGRVLPPALWFDVAFFLAATVGALSFYATSQWAVYEDWRRRLLRLPLVMVLGVGMAVNQSKAVFEALLGQSSPFVRTPKFGGQAQAYTLPKTWTPWIELGLAVYQLLGIAWSLSRGYYPSIPVQLLFVAGYGAVAWLSLFPRHPVLKMGPTAAK